MAHEFYTFPNRQDGQYKIQLKYDDQFNVFFQILKRTQTNSDWSIIATDKVGSISDAFEPIEDNIRLFKEYVIEEMLKKIETATDLTDDLEDLRQSVSEITTAVQTVDTVINKLSD